MKKNQGFYDLRISENQSMGKLSAMCERLVGFGYRTIAIDHVLLKSVFTPADDEAPGSKKHKRDQSLPEQSWIVPPPTNIDYVIQRFEKKLTILQRLTVHFSDVQQLHRLAREPHLSSYALLAVVPLTELAFQAACSFPRVDLITFNPSQPMGRITRKHYYLAVERGVFFEVMYSAAVGDSLQRQNIICQAHLYHSFGKSRNIVLTSGAKTANLLRGPYDVISLGLIFGLSEEQSKAALTHTCRKLLIDAEARRSGRSAVLVHHSHSYRINDQLHQSRLSEQPLDQSLPIKNEPDQSEPIKEEPDQSRPAKKLKKEAKVKAKMQA